jgi:hypothetical protein
MLVNFADVCAEALTKFEKLFIETASQPTDIDEEPSVTLGRISVL